MCLAAVSFSLLAWISLLAVAITQAPGAFEHLNKIWIRDCFVKQKNVADLQSECSYTLSVLCPNSVSRLHYSGNQAREAIPCCPGWKKERISLVKVRAQWHGDQSILTEGAILLKSIITLVPNTVFNSGWRSKFR